MKLFTLPNLLTLGNLLCGCVTILCLNEFIGNNKESLSHINSQGVLLYLIFGLLMGSLFLDLLDGMVARALKINSEIGIQLDSLADMVSFGLTPGLMMYVMITNYTEHMMGGFLGILGLFVTLFSALRLAKFNVDTEQSTYFKGLATPANTLLIFSVFWMYVQNGKILSPEYDLVILLVLLVLSCYLLISNIPLFSFKFKGLAWKDNHFKYLFLFISLILLGVFWVSSLPLIILLYIIISIVFRKNIVHA